MYKVDDIVWTNRKLLDVKNKMLNDNKIVTG